MGNILSIGVSGANAYQAMLDTAGNNISNSAVDGFSRQNTKLITRESMMVGSSFIGSGVDIGPTTRVVDEVLQGIHRDNISAEADYSIRMGLADQINTLLSNTDTGISDATNRFFSALDKLSSEPASNQYRQVLISESEGLVKRVNSLDTRFTDLSENVNRQISETVAEINSLASSIAKVNKDISTSSNIGKSSQPNELLDQRDRLLNELAGLVNISTIEHENGDVDVFMGHGQSLVVGAHKTNLETIRNPDDVSKVDVQTVFGSATQIITNVLEGGKLGGLRDIREEVLDPSRTKLSRIVMSLGLTFNALHAKGIDKNGNLGQAFFNDVNALALQLQRSLSNSRNQGTGIFAVSIDDIPRPELGPFQVFGNGSNIVDVGTLNQIGVLDLNINNINVRPAVAGDDTMSTADNASSAIAIAAAINGSVDGTGISAEAEINSLYLGTFTPGAFAANQFQINGQSVITTGADEVTLLNDINRLTVTTGVKAVGDGNLGITLVADDGRNIQLTSNTDTPAATFQYFDTNNAVALDKVQRASITLTSISSAITIAGNDPTTAGLGAGTTPALSSSLTDSDYELIYDGINYVLKRLSDDVLIVSTTSTTIQGDGMTITLNNGVVSAGDKFVIRPTAGGSKAFSLNIKDVKKLAMASPIRVQGGDNNSDGGSIAIGKIIDTSGMPASTATVLGNAFAVQGELGPPIRIEFDVVGDTTIYRIYDTSNGLPGIQIGPDQHFVPNQDNEIFPLPSVVDASFPGPNMPYTYDPGYRVTISGTPQAGDVFTITYNDNGIGNGDNAKELFKLKAENLLSDGTTSYQGAYTELISQVGTSTQAAKMNYNAAQSLLRGSEAQRESISGVNLNEEATKLIRYQQGFRAAAQVISIGSTLFDSLLDALRR